MNVNSGADSHSSPEDNSQKHILCSAFICINIPSVYYNNSVSLFFYREMRSCWRIPGNQSVCNHCELGLFNLFLLQKTCHVNSCLCHPYVSCSRYKTRVSLSTCWSETLLQNSPMFWDLSLCSDQISGQNEKSLNTFVSGMKDSHLSVGHCGQRPVALYIRPIYSTQL